MSYFLKYKSLAGLDQFISDSSSKDVKQIELLIEAGFADTEVLVITGAEGNGTTFLQNAIASQLVAQKEQLIGISGRKLEKAFRQNDPALNYHIFNCDFLVIDAFQFLIRHSSAINWLKKNLKSFIGQGGKLIVTIDNDMLSSNQLPLFIGEYRISEIAIPFRSKKGMERIALFYLPEDIVNRYSYKAFSENCTVRDFLNLLFTFQAQEILN